MDEEQSKKRETKREKPVLLIVEDEEGMRSQLKWALNETFEVYEAADEGEAVDAMNEQAPSIVLLDVNLNPQAQDAKEGLHLLSRILEIEPQAKVIMVTASDEKGDMLTAVREGAYDYYVKPINLEEIKIICSRALYIQQLERENAALSEALKEKGALEEMSGTCPKMQDVFALIRRVAPTDVTVLVTGESGTGKELAARAIHSLSARKGFPFVVINCGAIPENLLESELFGHEKGSFTDAHAQKKGKLEVAQGGTVFLDEIGEMSLALQVKILRFLQERVVERVGGTTPIELDVRVIAATNSNLKEKMKEGDFREDLYYRLSVVNICMPPLREREDDIEVIASLYLKKSAAQYGKKIKGLSKEALKALRSYPWPGNVRELENKMKRAVVLSAGPLVSAQDLSLDVPAKAYPKLLKDARRDLEMMYLKESLKKHKGNISRAAREIGISRVSFYDLMKKYKIGEYGGK